jgi:hypothetical protein
MDLVRLNLIEDLLELIKLALFQSRAAPFTPWCWARIHTVFLFGFGFQGCTHGSIIPIVILILGHCASNTRRTIATFHGTVRSRLRCIRSKGSGPLWLTINGRECPVRFCGFSSIGCLSKKGRCHCFKIDKLGGLKFGGFATISCKVINQLSCQLIVRSLRAKEFNNVLLVTVELCV